MPLGLSLGRPLTPLSVATSAFSSVTTCRRASFSASSRSARASSSARGRPERLIFPEADMAGTGRVRVGSAQPRQLTSARAFAPRTQKGEPLSSGSPLVKLALRLHSALQVRVPCGGLVRPSPERPGDDVGGPDASLREADGDAAEFLDRPADEVWPLRAAPRRTRCPA